MNAAVFSIFVLPCLIGATIRAIFLKWRRGYFLTVAFALLSVIVWFWTEHLVRRGVDGTVLLWACMAAELFVGSFLAGGISLLIRKIKH